MGDEDGAASQPQDELWAALVPPLARDPIAGAWSEQPLPRVAEVRGALLRADLSGFTRLTEEVSSRSAAGAEDVKVLIDDLFEPLVAAIDDFGGEIVRFPGDGLLALFRVDGGDGVDGGEDLESAVQSATASALRAVETVDRVAAELGYRTRLRVGVACGPMWVSTVGGVEDRLEIVLGGEPLARVSRIVDDAELSSVVVSAAAFEKLGGTVHHELLPGGVHRIESIEPGAVGKHEGGPRSRDVAESDERARAYLPRSLRARLAATPARWLAEFRRATVLFIGIDARDLVEPEAAERLQRWFRCIQVAVYANGGSVNQLLLDGEQVVAVVGFGTSLHHHEDDATRGVHAALAIETALEREEARVAIGVATGRVFTGLRGGESYRDYALVGTPPNRASRLMRSAVSGILCDDATRLGARQRIRFAALEPIVVKGVEDTLSVFRPAQRRERELRGQPSLLGRRVELARLGDLLARFKTSDGSSCVVIEGEAGIGKSRLLLEWLDDTQARGVRVLTAEADAASGQPYRAFRRPAVERILEIERIDDRAERQEIIRHRLDAIPARLPHYSLMNGILDLEFDEPDEIQGLGEESRARQTRELLIELLRDWSHDDPVVLVLEDAHWLDSASWVLVEALLARMAKLLLVVVTRPGVPAHPAPELRRILARESTERLVLDALDEADAFGVACERLDVDEIPAAVRAMIHEKAAGHPLYTQELASALAERSIVEVVGGECLLRCDETELGSVPFPETLQDLVTGRIDELDPPEQLTLKVASVLGERFTLAGLSALHPLHEEGSRLAEQLDRMSQVDLVRRGDVAGEYRFKHGITAEVAYQLLPFSQRRELHESAARWFSSERAEGAADAATLAFHWTESGIVEEGLLALERAGELAMGAGAHREAARHFARALELGATGAPERARVVRWHRRLGDAELGLGNLPAARRSLEAAVAELGATPRGRFGLARGLGAELARQLWHRVRPGSPRPVADERSALVRDVASALYSLTAIHFTEEAPLPHVWSALRSLNLAERIPLSRERINGYVALHTILLGLGFNRFARGYAQRAQGGAADLSDALSLAETSFGTGVGHLAVGRLPEARRELQLGRQLYEGFGGSTRMWEAISADAYACYAAGDYGNAVDLYQRLERDLEQQHNPRFLSWSLGWQAAVAVRRGRAREGVRLAQIAVPYAKEAGDRAAEIGCMGFLALARLRVGDRDLARNICDRAREEIKALGGVGAPWVLDGMSAVIQTCVELPAHDAEQRASDLANAEEVAKVLVRFSRQLRIGRAAAALANGRIAAARGQTRLAIPALRRAAGFAAEAGQAYEEALALLELGRLDGALDEPLDGLERAHRLFEQLGAQPESEQCATEITRRRVPAA